MQADAQELQHAVGQWDIKIGQNSMLAKHVNRILIIRWAFVVCPLRNSEVRWTGALRSPSRTDSEFLNKAFVMYYIRKIISNWHSYIYCSSRTRRGYVGSLFSFFVRMTIRILYQQHKTMYFLSLVFRFFVCLQRNGCRMPDNDSNLHVTMVTVAVSTIILLSYYPYSHHRHRYFYCQKQCLFCGFVDYTNYTQVNDRLWYPYCVLLP